MRCRHCAHRYTAIQVYRYTGVQVCTIPVYRYTRLAYLYTGTPGSRCLLLLAGYRWCCCCRCAAAAIQRCTCALSCRHGENSHAGNSFATLVQVYKCTGIQIYSIQVYWYTGIQVYRYKAVQVYRYTRIQVCRYTGIQVYRRTGFARAVNIDIRY